MDDETLELLALENHRLRQRLATARQERDTLAVQLGNVLAERPALARALRPERPALDRRAVKALARRVSQARRRSTAYYRAAAATRADMDRAQQLAALEERENRWADGMASADELSWLLPPPPRRMRSAARAAKHGLTILQSLTDEASAARRKRHDARKPARTGRPRKVAIDPTWTAGPVPPTLYDLVGGLIDSITPQGASALVGPTLELLAIADMAGDALLASMARDFADWLPRIDGGAR